MTLVSIAVTFPLRLISRFLLLSVGVSMVINFFQEFSSGSFMFPGSRVVRTVPTPCRSSVHTSSLPFHVIILRSTLIFLRGCPHVLFTVGKGRSSTVSLIGLVNYLLVFTTTVLLFDRYYYLFLYPPEKSTSLGTSGLSPL